MKSIKYLLLLSLITLSLSKSTAQITDTGVLRNYVNANVVTNGNRQITGLQMNTIFNGYLNIMRTYTPSARTLTINGVTYDLSANRSWTVSGGGGGGGATPWDSITGTPTTIAGYGITNFNTLGDARWSLLAHSHTFASLTSKPTTLAGYGITDAELVANKAVDFGVLNHTKYPSTLAVANYVTGLGYGDVFTSGSYSNPAWITGLAWSKITSKPTTLSGYGITDAVPVARTLTINGVTYDLSANRSWTVSGGGGGGGGSTPWDSITSTPTTIAGYGITDFNSLGDARWSLLAHTHTFASLTSKPTTLAGYGITDPIGDVFTSGSYANPAWITSLAYSKLTGLPTTIGGYGITDFNSLGDARWEPIISAGSSGQYWAYNKTWQTLNMLALSDWPSPVGHSGKYLTTDGTNYSWATAGGSGWGIIGQSGTNSGTNYVGTSDLASLLIKTNNVARVHIDSVTGDLTMLNSGDIRLADGASLYAGKITLNQATVGLYLRDGGPAGRIMIAKAGSGGALGDVHFVGLPSFTKFRFYGSGDLDSTGAVADWMNIGPGAVNINVPANFNQYIKGYSSGINASNETIRIADFGAGNHMGIGRGSTLGRTMMFFVDDTYGAYKFCGGGVFNSSAADWMNVGTNGVRIGGGSLHASAILDASSTARGVLLTPKTTAQRDAIPTPANTNVSANTSRANLGLYAGNGWSELYGSKYTLATDAAYTFDASTSFVTLPEITANRIVTLPAVATYVGKEITVKVANSAGFTWTLSAAALDKTDANVTTLTNDTVYKFYSNGTNWLITSIY